MSSLWRHYPQCNFSTSYFAIASIVESGLLRGRELPTFSVYDERYSENPCTLWNSLMATWTCVLTYMRKRNLCGDFVSRP